MTIDEQNTNDVPEILIVEDSPTQAERLKHTLAQTGYRVILARNGREALGAIAASRPSLVISDIVMPEMNGYELCRNIKHDEKLRSIPVILLTSLSDPVDVIRGLESGADNFLFKPFDERYLLSRVSYMLAHRRMRETDGAHMGLEIHFANQQFFITSDRLQILNLLLSTYEAAVERNRELAVARDQLNYLNESLEARVKDRTTALQCTMMELEETTEQLRTANEELEMERAKLELRVRERTDELERKNRELEAFSYSVSHDLRTPLRAMDGFSQALLGNHTNNLDPRAQDYLRRIVAASKRMGQLIDDLLQLSRVDRMDLTRTNLDLSKLAEEVWNGLSDSLSEEKISFSAEEAIVAYGDRRLLRIVLDNLLGNARKFSSKTEEAVVEFGAIWRDDQRAYFVRDNGAGFNMELATRLFSPFQRLHTEAEFQGTGIGLATVYRIIDRHGGRVWGESEVDKGATFYWTLPPPNAEM